MKKVLVIFLLSFASLTNAQDSIPRFWVGINLGSQMTNLKFTSSTGESFSYNNELNFTNGFSFAYLKKGLLLEFNADYYRVSANYQDEQTFTAIDLGYLQPSLNVAYVFSFGNFPIHPRIGLGGGYSFLIDGTQNLDGTFYNVKQTEQLKSTDAGLNLNFGVVVFSKGNLALSCIYNYRLGLTNIENATTNQETSTNIHALHLKIQMGL